MIAPLTWTDLYGALHAAWRGLPGGHRWLVSCAPEHAQDVARLLPTHFKGEVQLLVTDTLTPLQETVRAWAPRGVLIVDRDLTGGPGLTLPERAVQADGLTYREGGVLPAWRSALPGAGPEGECAAASAVSALGVPVLVCSPARVAEGLLAWWRLTPHALTPEPGPRATETR